MAESDRPASGTIRSAPTASSSSNTRRPIRRRSAGCSSRWASPRSPRHRSKNVLLYRQGDINFIVNAEPDSFAQAFARVHGPSICAIAFRVKDAARAYRKCVEQGAWGVEAHPGPMELNIPAIKGIGDSLIYLVDRYPAQRRAACRSTTSTSCRCPASTSIRRARASPYIDHLTHNVHRGRMDEWASFYERLFNFREVRYFDIEGKLTGLEEQGDDEPLRQDPHSDQRELGRQEPDPGIPGRLPRRRHPARRARHRRHLRDRRDAARARRRVPGHARHLLRGAADAPARPPRRTRRACARTASCSTARRPRTRCCCRSSPRR